MRTGALPDWTKHNHPAQLAIREQARRAEAAEAKVAELEASAIGGYEDGWHALRAERDEMKAKLEAVRGLPRFNVENGDPQMGGGYGQYRIKAVPKSQWINDGTFVRVKELEALLKEQTK